MEAFIEPFQLKTGQFLPSSPEFAMKKLLAGGLERIFQICSAFRDEPFSQQHRPEFTILEFYRAFSDYLQIMSDVETLIESLAIAIFKTPSLEFSGQSISVKTPWPRLQINDLFKQHLEIDLRIETTIAKLRARVQELNLPIISSPDDS